MKELLITFAFLLLLLTLLSTFGGSIRPGEPFYQPALQTPSSSPYEPSRKTLQENEPSMNPLYSSTNQISEQFMNASPSTLPPPPNMNSAASMPAMPSAPDMSSTPSMPSVPSMPSAVPTMTPEKRENYLSGAPIEDQLERPHISEQYANRNNNIHEGFMIEPFESDNGPTFASF